MTPAGIDVWISDYTTGSGVHVAGHWRRRHSAAAVHEDVPRQPQPSPSDSQAPGTASGDHPSLGTAVRSGDGAEPTSPSDPTSLAGAESRYKAAIVAVGVSTLKRRRGEAGDLEGALRERSEARAALQALRQDSLPAPGGAPEQPTAETAAPSNDEQNRCPRCGQFRGSEHECPPPAELPAASYAELKGEDRVKAMVADLEQSVQAIMESGQLQRWLDAMASNGLQRWSANNRILAAVQMLQRARDLDNLHMMGFRQWEGLHRKVTKGAKAVWILAPITRKVVDEDDDGKHVEQHRVVGFKSVPVFDISDTHGQPLPETPIRPPTGEASPGTLDGLRSRVGAAGYRYEETEIPGCSPDLGTGTLGFTEPGGRRIVIDSRLSEVQKVSTIAHELAHVHGGHVENLGEYQRHRGRMETEAEMTAYLVNRSRGMTAEQVDSFSPGYIASWSKGDPKVMHAAMDKAMRAYNQIMEDNWPKEGDTQA